MKFKLMAEYKGKYIEIPLTRLEIRALGDLAFWFGENDWKNFKLNKMDKEIESLGRKWTFLCFDVMDDGIAYPADIKTGKIDRRHPVHHYLVKKPKWIKK